MIMAMARQNMELQLDVYSDVICPWCYVGMKRFEAARELLGRPSDVTVTWRPFELNPTMPAAGMDRKVYLEAKFGSTGAVESMLDHVREAGRQSGITFAFDRIPRTPNTFDAHRLIWLAARHGRQQEMVTRLFRGYFEEGMDLSDRGALVQAATEAGIEKGGTAVWLASQEGVKEVRAEEHVGLQLGIRAVPYFSIEGQPGLSGAQPPAVIAEWLRRSTAGITRSTAGAR
jgi:predicted DsbA family dithiol-disulfide isomerase